MVALDCRGHGESDKPHTVAGYRHDEMARDVLAVMDDADIEKAHVMGYSMGGFISIHLAAAHAERMTKLVIGGVGETYFGREIGPEARRSMIADALLAADPKTIENPTGRAFRAFADQPGKDRIALAACMRGMSPHLPLATLAALKGPVLVVCGDKDDTSGRPEPLARRLGGGTAALIAGRDHMSAVGDRHTRQAVMDFFQG